MEAKLSLHDILLKGDIPNHWPKSSLYRLQSIKTRVVISCPRELVEKCVLMQSIKQITKYALIKKHGASLKQNTLRTYQSVLIRYVAEKLTNQKLKPWQAINYFKSLN